MKLLITSGGTRVPIDAVRSITNMSTGYFGSKLAESLLLNGSDKLSLDFFTSRKGREPFESDEQPYLYEGEWRDTIRYDTFEEYLNVKKLIKENQYDVIISAAAVSDYTVKDVIAGKMESSGEQTITLVPVEKVIKSFKELAPNCKLVAFKLLADATKEDRDNAARKSLETNNADIVVVNDISQIRRGRRELFVYDKDFQITYIPTKADKKYPLKNSPSGKSRSVTLEMQSYDLLADLLIEKFNI